MTARVPLIAVIAAGAAALTLTVAFAPAPLRVVIALPLALLVPGAAIAVMAFPAGTGIGRAIDVAVAFVLSIAFYPLAALSLHAVTIRISPMTMAGSADAVVLSAVAATFIRIHRSGRRPGPVVLADGRPDLLAAARALAVVVVAVATVAIMRAVLPAPPAGAYTSFGLRGNWSHVHGIAYIDPARELMIRTGHHELHGSRAPVPSPSVHSRWQLVAAEYDCRSGRDLAHDRHRPRPAAPLQPTHHARAQAERAQVAPPIASRRQRLSMARQRTAAPPSARQ